MTATKLLRILTQPCLTSYLHLYGDLGNGDFKLDLERLDVAENPHGEEGGGDHPRLGVDCTTHVMTAQPE